MVPISSSFLCNLFIYSEFLGHFCQETESCAWEYDDYGAAVHECS